jgi:hypothetical protein
MKLYWIRDYSSCPELEEGEVIKETSRVFIYRHYYKLQVRKVDMAYKGIYLCPKEAWVAYIERGRKDIEKMQEKILSTQQKLVFVCDQIEALKKEGLEA